MTLFQTITIMKYATKKSTKYEAGMIWSLMSWMVCS